jgi:hypothetical protein
MSKLRVSDVIRACKRQTHLPYVLSGGRQPAVVGASGAHALTQQAALQPAYSTIYGPTNAESSQKVLGPAEGCNTMLRLAFLPFSGPLAGPIPVKKKLDPKCWCRFFDTKPTTRILMLISHQ